MGVKYSVIAVVTANGVRYIDALAYICVTIKKIHDLHLCVSKNGFLNKLLEFIRSEFV